MTSKFSYELYHIFNKDGVIRQVENALEAVYDSNQIVAVSSDEYIVCVCKKHQKDLLQEETVSPIRQVENNIFMLTTGLQADVDFVVDKTIDLASELKYNLGGVLPHKILVRALAEKFQKYIQKSSIGIYAFATGMFGLENNKPTLYYTDLSAVEYQCHAFATGKDHAKMNTYLEKKFKKNLPKNELIHLGVATLMQSIGNSADRTELDIFVYSKDEIRKLDDNEVDQYIHQVVEKL